MSSSTSSSDGRPVLARGLGFTILAIVTFVSMTSAYAAAWKLKYSLRYHAAVADVPVPPSEKYYLTSYKADLNHLIFKYDLYSIHDSLTRADVLFLGSSRMMYALSQGSVMRFLEKRGLRGYAIGFGCGETSRFAEDMIRAYELKPRLVVVNASYFFNESYTSAAKAAHAKSRFDALREQFEMGANFWFNHKVQGFVPHLVDLVSAREILVVFRSRDDGTWLLYPLPDRGLKFENPQVERRPITEEQVQIAQKFKTMVESWGGRLIFTHIPNPEGPRSSSESLAKRVGVPFLSPQLSGLESHDGSHLTKESINRFTEAFQQELDAELTEHPLPPREYRSSGK